MILGTIGISRMQHTQAGIFQNGTPKMIYGQNGIRNMQPRRFSFVFLVLIFVKYYLVEFYELAEIFVQVLPYSHPTIEYAT